MRSNTTSAALTVLLFVGCCGQLHAENDVGYIFSYYGADYDAYEHGYGFEAWCRRWQEGGNWGFGLVGGATAYEGTDDSYSETFGATTISISASGSALLIPLGGSVFYQFPVGDGDRVILDGGFRYVLVDSDIDVTATVTGLGTVTSNLDIDDGVVGVVGANYEKVFSDRCSLLLGVGYQFDVAKGDVSWIGTKLDDNELESVLGRIGLILRN